MNITLTEKEFWIIFWLFLLCKLLSGVTEEIGKDIGKFIRKKIPPRPNVDKGEEKMFPEWDEQKHRPKTKMSNCPICDEDELGMISKNYIICYKCGANWTKISGTWKR